MIAQELEVTLHKAFVEARQARHKFLTVEHLLLALLDNPLAAEVLRACACNIEDLRKTLQNFLSDNTPVLPQSSEADIEPTPGFERVIKRAIMHVQSTSAGKKLVTVADVLVAIFDEKDSQAVYYLHQQGVTRAEIQKQTGADLRSGDDVAATTVSARKLDIPRGITKALREAVKDIVKRRWRSITKAPQGKTMIAQELEISLHMAFVEARQSRHEFITVEHLLLALLDNPSAADVLRACACNIEDLRRSLQNFVSDNTPVLPQSSEADTQPTLGFQRVIQRAIMHVQSTSNGKKEVTGANVLVAIFGEKDSHAVYYLHQQGATRLDVVNYISHGITRREQETTGPQPEAPALNAEALASVLDDLLAQARDGRIHPLVGRAISHAREAGQRFVTVEQLLLAMLEDASAVQVLSSWGCDVEGLQKALADFVSDNVPALPKDSATHTQPAAGFARVIERATMRAIVRGIAAPVAAGEARQAGVGDVLGAILEGEEDSPAVTFFRKYTRNLDLLGQAGSRRTGGPA